MKFIIPFLAAVVGLSACKSNTETMRISSVEGSAESVFLTDDNKGNPVVVWTERRKDGLKLFFAVSEGDSKFSKAVNVPVTNDVATHAEGMPKVAFRKDGTIVAAFEKKAPTKENKYAGAVYYTTSADGGKSWSREQYLHSDTVAGRSRSYFDLQRLPDGEVGAAWLDIKLDKGTGGRSVRFARTRDAKGFGNEILVDSSACQCCRIDVYTDDSDAVFVAYRGLKKGPMGRQIRDMMIATSINGGDTFSSPMLISADNWFIEGCPHTGPSLCGNKAGLFSLWYTEGTGTGIYYAKKEEGNATFASRNLVSRDGRHPQLCAQGDRIAMLWEENTAVGNKSNTVIHFKVVKDGEELSQGALTSRQTNAFLPVVNRANDGFIVAYLMEEDQGVGVFVGRLL